MTAKTARCASAKSASKVQLVPVLQYDDCTLAIPDQLSLGNDGRLYLTSSSQANCPSVKLQTMNLKESVAWFQFEHERSLKLIEGEKFNDWLKLVEQAQAQTI